MHARLGLVDVRLEEVVDREAVVGLVDAVAVALVLDARLAPAPEPEGMRDLCGIRSLVLGYPKNSSKFSTAVKLNSNSTIFGPAVLAPPEVSTTGERVSKKNVPEHSR